MKYDKEITDKICRSIIELKGRVNACKEAGITFETFCQWMKDEKKPEFSDAIKKAEEQCNEKGKNIAIQSIFKAMATSWQAGAWWLERNFKSKYALRHEITGEDGAPIVPITKIIIERANIKRDNSAGEAAQLEGEDQVIKGGEQE